MRKWKRINEGNEIIYISDKGEKIYKTDHYVSYAPPGSNIAYKCRREKYYSSPQIRRLKFDKLKEIKAYFEMKGE